MSKSVFIDPRWENAGGIGTFFNEINKINKYAAMNVSGNPASPLDTFNLAKVSLRSKGVLFFPGYIPPFFSKNPYVFTIHDLNHLDRDENSSKKKRFFYNTIIKKGCINSSYIFTVSEFSRTRIIDWSGVDENKVINVGNGVSSSFSPEGPSNYYNFDYILCVSNRKAHKNEPNVIKSFAQANIDADIKLVFTGKSTVELESLIEKYGLIGRVIFTGFINANELPILYRSAKLLVFPSFYEGFGLPVIEAQASGVPVITSNSSSLAEISGNASLLVDPYSIDEISNSIEMIFNNSSLSSDLVKKGLLNVKKYSWDKTAGLVDKYIKKLM